MQVKTFLRQLKFDKITWQGVWTCGFTRGVSTTACKHRQVVSCICSRQIASHTQHTCELQSWTVVTSVLRFMPNPKSMDVCDQVASIFIVYLYLRLLYSLPLPSTTCHLTSLVALNLRPLALEKRDIIAKPLLKGRGHNKHTFAQAMTLLCKRTRFWKVCVATSLEGVPLSSMQFKVYRAHLWRKYGPLTVTLTKQIVLGKPWTNMEDLYCTICAAPFYTGTKVLFSTDIAGTVGNVRQCRIASTLWILNVRKSQLCFPLLIVIRWQDFLQLLLYLKRDQSRFLFFILLMRNLLWATKSVKFT